jgi:glutathione S-transferase
MITLHQFAPAFGLPNASPFCMKVETWLRLAGLPFRCENSGNVLKAPKKKLTWIEDDDGTVVADSGFIVDHLSARHGIRLDAALTPRQRAQALAMQRLMEENLYWAVVHTRWATDEGWAKTREAFFGTLAPPLRWVLPPLARRGLLAELRGQGLGRHSAAEIHAIGSRDVNAIADFLGEQPFMMGEAPTNLDATAHAFLANLLWAPVESPILQAARARPTLEAYCRRMQQRCFQG